jgi:hypothetical protein
MSVKFTNAELVGMPFGRALGMLSGKPLPPKLAWTVVDVIEFVNARCKQYSKIQKEIAERNKIKDGTAIDSLPEPLRKEFEELDALECEIPIEPITLPEKDAAGREIWYEPMIFVVLQKIIKHQ